MVHVRVILLGLIRQLLLPCQGIALLVEPANDCLDAVPGDRCYKFVTWALEKGIEKHPDWFPTFKRSDSEEHNFKQIQEILHSRNKAGCSKPCFTEPDTASPTNPEVQEATRVEAPAAALEEAKPEAAPAAPAEEKEPVEASAPAAQEAAPAVPAASAAEEAKQEAAPAPLSEEAEPADALAPAAQEQSPRSNLIGTLQTEVKSLEAMKDSPSLKTLREEKRQLIRNLQAADKLEAGFEGRHLRNLQTLT